MAPPRSINIGPYSFPITAAYTDGVRAVGPAEHEVLDGARAERVRKKAHRVFEKLRARSGRRTLTEGELRHLAGVVAELDRTMDLVRLANPQDATALSRPGHAFATLGGDAEEASDFDAELSRLAELRIVAEETARGVMLQPNDRAAALAALRDDPGIREAARARVEVALAERDRMLTELF